jgi:hypothetical protein
MRVSHNGGDGHRSDVLLRLDLSSDEGQKRRSLKKVTGSQYCVHLYLHKSGEMVSFVVVTELD